MLLHLQLNCDLNSNLHLSFGLRSGVVGHFLYIIGWEEQLHLSTMVTFPPVVNRTEEANVFTLCMFVLGHDSQDDADDWT